MSNLEISRRDALTMAGSAAAVSLLPNTRSDAADSSPSTTKPVRSTLSLFSRHLQWTGIEEGIEVAASAGYGGIAWTVRPGAHIEPQHVARDLPRAVELTHRAGLATPLISTLLIDADSPYAQSILETATGLGIGTYRAASFQYDPGRDVSAQVQALRPRVAALARLNERYGATALFHTHAGDEVVGGAVWDIWLLLRDFDPDRVAIDFDTGYGSMAAGSGWNQAVRFAGGRIRHLSLKDFRWRQQDQGGTRRWVGEICQPGQGMANLRDIFAYFRSSGFQGPLEVQFDYPIEVPNHASINLMNMAPVGQWKLEIPKADLIAVLKRDADFYAALLRDTGLAAAS